MSNIKLLDCTLRDGGYINNWEFGESSIRNIISSLISSGIDYIEYGFLQNKSGSNSSLFKKIEDIKKYQIADKCALMINFGNFNVSEIVPVSDIDIEIRIAFKKHHLTQIKNSLLVLSDKGVKFSLNPMHTSLYTDSELDFLIKLANETNPTSLTIVDTMGIMTPNDTEKLFKCFVANLNQDIAIGFHSHDNMDLSFKNLLKVLEIDFNREFIIDTCLGGIGRGGGMLHTEIVSDYLNKNYHAKYNVELLNKTTNDIISPIINRYFYDRYPYYLSAKNKCHPNYAKFLTDNGIKDYKEIDTILSSIPEKDKTIYNPEILKYVTL